MGLESYAYNLRNSLQDEKISRKMDADDAKLEKRQVNETIDWLDHNHEAEKEEYELHQKELKEIANPIMTKLYSAL